MVTDALKSIQAIRRIKYKNAYDIGIQSVCRPLALPVTFLTKFAPSHF